MPSSNHLRAAAGQFMSAASIASDWYRWALGRCRVFLIPCSHASLHVSRNSRLRPDAAPSKHAMCCIIAAWVPHPVKLSRGHAGPRLANIINVKLGGKIEFSSTRHGVGLMLLPPWHRACSGRNKQE